MIGCFSDAYSAGGAFYGGALSFALSAIELGIRPLLIAPLSTDESGRSVIDLLIRKGIFFDPDLIFPDLHSPSGPDLEDSVFSALKKEAVESIIDLNPELSLYYISHQSLTSPSVSAKIAGALHSRDVRCPVLLDIPVPFDMALLEPYKGLNTMLIGPGLDIESGDLLSHIAKHFH